MSIIGYGGSTTTKNKEKVEVHNGFASDFLR